MARKCSTCGTVHDDGDCPLGGGNRDKKKTPRHRHQWKFWKSRTNLLGEVYDVYKCTVAGCNEIDERRK